MFTIEQLIAFGEAMSESHMPDFMAGLEVGLLFARLHPDLAEEIFKTINQSMNGVPFRADLSVELAVLGVSQIEH